MGDRNRPGKNERNQIKNGGGVVSSTVKPADKQETAGHGNNRNK